MSVTQEMRAKLLAEFGDGNFEIVDDSESHRGHGGFQEGGESHFNVSVTSEKFVGMSRLQRHRAVHGALGADILGRIHALALKLDVPADQG
ncbi:MAG: BolA family protein [Paracoccaceae bacterium]